MVSNMYELTNENKLHSEPLAYALGIKSETKR